MMRTASGPPASFVKELGSGSFGTCMLAVDHDNEQVAVKFIPRGRKVDKNVEREVIMHSRLQHPNVVGFKRVFLTPESLGIVLECATGGELFDRVKSANRFDEHMARFFFQQLIAGVDFIHQQGLAHRDLKLENTLIKLEQTKPGKQPTPVLKIADFGFCKHEDLNTPCKSRVGTPAYISPEVLQAPNVYDGKAADVWACGVHLYIMLMGWYPFTDPREPKNFAKTASNIMHGRYGFPHNVTVSQECQDLIKHMLKRNPLERITLSDVKQTAWFQTNLSKELADNCRGLPCYPPCKQPVDEIQAIRAEARTVPSRLKENMSVPLGTLSVCSACEIGTCSPLLGTDLKLGHLVNDVKKCVIAGPPQENGLLSPLTQST